MLTGKSILITGGTGFLGQKIVQFILNNYPQINRLVIYSRSDSRQEEMSNNLPQVSGAPIRYFIGDIRDKNRLKMALEGIDVVIHTAFLQKIITAEYNPFEAIKTNIQGTQNLIEACIELGVSDVVSISNEKIHSHTLIGATQMVSDHLMQAAQSVAGNKKIKFSVLRIGSIIDTPNGFLKNLRSKKINQKSVSLYNSELSRFYLTSDEVLRSIFKIIQVHFGGEIFVLKSKSFKLVDLINAIYPNAKIEYTKLKDGQRNYEELISPFEIEHTYESDLFYIIKPLLPNWDLDKYNQYYQKVDSEKLNQYSSANSTLKLDVDDLTKMVSKLDQ